MGVLSLLSALTKEKQVSDSERAMPVDFAGI